jgi:putative DeoR family transcriptional regulator (stage III sporulation protein D)
VIFLKGLPEERAVSLAHYIIENKATVRQAAKVFDISKSIVHTVVSFRTVFNEY